jgi:hypothetical protein
MLLKPVLPPYDLAAWRSQPFPKRLEQVCQAWALQGYGSPLGVYALYVAKIGVYCAMWAVFCSFSPGFALGDPATWATETAFTKAILWTMLFEGLGFGCGSGPLTGRYLPPFGGALYFLWPGTTKLPLVALPVVGGHKRTVLDVALYGLVLGLLVRALLAATVTPAMLVPILVLIPILGVLDRTLFLVFRSEHYLSVLICLLAGADWIAGSKAVWMAIWWWAATSKVNRHFPAVLCVMVSNSPVVPVAIKRRMYTAFPADLRPSRLAHVLAHTGTALEYAFPLVLMLSGGGWVTWAMLALMTSFHLFILSQVPMGVPLEWNVMMIYGGFVLFGVHADVAITSIRTPWLVAWLLLFHLILPIYGSAYPERVSFLLSMRYYAGNWACNIWLFRGDASAKLDTLTKWSPAVRAQLARFYDRDTIDALLSKVVAFRAMHLHGRAACDLAARAVDDLDRYEWLDGEVVAGLVVGWNFGEGHLHDRTLLDAIQAQCGFEAGELRVVSIESEPWFTGKQSWTITDAKDGVVERGEIVVADLVDRQPWPTISG